MFVLNKSIKDLQIDTNGQDESSGHCDTVCY